jgi:hypothetical protein
VVAWRTREGNIGKPIELPRFLVGRGHRRISTADILGALQPYQRERSVRLPHRPRGMYAAREKTQR